jgi:hypothetical protein
MRNVTNKNVGHFSVPKNVLGTWGLFKNRMVPGKMGQMGTLVK